MSIKNGVAVVTYGRKKAESKKSSLGYNSQKTWDLIIKKEKSEASSFDETVGVKMDKENEQFGLASPRNVTKRTGVNDSADMDSILSDLESLIISPSKVRYEDQLSLDGKSFLAESPVQIQLKSKDLYQQKQQFLTLSFESKALQQMTEAIQPYLKEDLEKVGEAAYSEVYANTSHTFVLKVIPVVKEALEEDCPYMLLGNLIHEFWMTESISKAYSPFHSMSCGFLKMIQSE
jgi:hypothetical protein